MTQQGNGNKTRHRILILGGGTAGIITASLLQRAGQTDIAILEPSRQHFYQPLWTLVGVWSWQKQPAAAKRATFRREFGGSRIGLRKLRPISRQ